MTPSRECTVNGKQVEEFYWNGKWIVYVDNKLSELTYYETVKAVEARSERRTREMIAELPADERETLNLKGMI